MKIITLILITFLTFNLNAQECGTPISTTNQVFNIPIENDAQFCVSVKFHIVRETNGTGGFDSSQIQNAINYINQFYNSHLINVSSLGFDYINNSNLNSFDDTEFSQLTSLNNVPNAINYYIVNTAPYYGRAGAIISNNLVIRSDRVFAPTSPHELGHCLNLLHTFQGTASGTSGCAENINGSNCSSCGDNVCDTPADANIEATGGYSPDLTNIMSYYITRNHFTTQQGLRMRNAIGGSPILQATLSSQCTSITGFNNICATSNAQYALSNPQNTSILWSVTPNLQIVNSSNSGITVKAINSTINGKETITANTSGMMITKVIWVGKPKITIYQPTVSTCNTILQIKSATTNATLQEQGINYLSWERDGEEVGTGYNYSFGGYYSPIMLSATNTCGTTTYNSFIPLRLPVKCGSSPISRTSNSINDNTSFYRIYPNPSKDIVNIDLRDQNNQPKKRIAITGELFDLMGQSKSKVEIIDNKATFSVRSLNKGIYILRIYINGQVESHQIIVE
jgi:hypothetical protein